MTAHIVRPTPEEAAATLGFDLGRAYAIWAVSPEGKTQEALEHQMTNDEQVIHVCTRQQGDRHSDIHPSRDRVPHPLLMGTHMDYLPVRVGAFKVSILTKPEGQVQPYTLFFLSTRKADVAPQAASPFCG